MTRWNMYSLVLISCIAMLLLLKFDFFPYFIDIYHHLAVAMGYEKAGGFVTNAFWEYAPAGRVNLYPPFFHLVLLGLIKLGLPLIYIARLMDIIIFPVFLIILWITSRALYGPKEAFFATLLSSCMYSFYLSSSNFIPVTLACMFGLVSFYCIERQRVLSAVICLSLAFYTHVQVPWIFVISFIIYGFLNPCSRLRCFLTAGGSILLALPYLFYVIAHRHQYALQWPYENFVLELNLVLLLAIVGAHRSMQARGVLLFPLILALTAGLLAWSYPYRYLSGQGTLGLIMLSAIGAGALMKSNKFAMVLIVAAVLCSPSIAITRTKEVRLVPLNSFIVNVLSQQKPLERSNDYTLYTKNMEEIVRCIRTLSAPGDIIYANLPFLGTIVSVLADRANSQGMLEEVTSRGSLDPISNAKWIVWFKESQNREELDAMVTAYSLVLASETPMAYIYKNDLSKSQSQISTPVMSNFWLFALVGFVFIFLCWDLFVFKLFL